MAVVDSNGLGKFASGSDTLEAACTGEPGCVWNLSGTSAGFRAVAEISSDSGASWRPAPQVMKMPTGFGPPIPIATGIQLGTNEIANFGVPLGTLDTTVNRTRLRATQLTSGVVQAKFTLFNSQIPEQQSLANDTVVLLNLPSLARGVNGDSGILNVPSGGLSLHVGVSITAVSGTNPTLTCFLETMGADGVWYPVWSPSAQNATGVISQTIGRELETTKFVTDKIRLRWVIGGTASPTVTFTASIIGRPLNK